MKISPTYIIINTVFVIIICSMGSLIFPIVIMSHYTYLPLPHSLTLSFTPSPSPSLPPSLAPSLLLLLVSIIHTASGGGCKGGKLTSSCILWLSVMAFAVLLVSAMTAWIVVIVCWIQDDTGTSESLLR